MSRFTRHVYRVEETTLDADVEVGQIIIDNDHLRPHHEPMRVWEYVSARDGEEAGFIAARHIGEYEEVRDLLEDELDQAENAQEIY